MNKAKKKRPRRPLTDQQKLAAKVIFDTGRMAEAAAAAGVHRTTIWRWYKRADFQRELNRIHDKWIREKRRETIREWHNSPEYKKRKAAERRLDSLAKKLEAAGNSGDMNAYRKACAAYDRCYNEAFGDVLKAFDRYFQSQKPSPTQKPRKPKQYIIEII